MLNIIEVHFFLGSGRGVRGSDVSRRVEEKNEHNMNKKKQQTRMSGNGRV